MPCSDSSDSRPSITSGAPDSTHRDGVLTAASERPGRASVASCSSVHPHGEHRPPGQGFDQPPARGDERERVFEREDAGQGGRDELAQAVPQHRGRADAPALPESRERVFDDEQGRLGHLRCGGSGSSRGLPLPSAASRSRSSKFRSRLGAEQFAAAIDLLPESPLALVDLPGHPGAAGRPVRETEMPTDRPRRSPASDGLAPQRGLVQARGGVRGARRTRRRAGGRMRVRPSCSVKATLPRSVSPGSRRDGAARFAAAASSAVGVLAESTRSSQERAAGAAAAGASSRMTCAFVPPTPNALDAGPARAGRRCPLGETGVHEERGVREIDRRVGALEVEARRNQAGANGERRLDQARDPGGDVQVADVRLDRSDGAEALRRRWRSERRASGRRSRSGLREAFRSRASRRSRSTRHPRRRRPGRSRSPRPVPRRSGPCSRPSASRRCSARTRGSPRRSSPRPRARRRAASGRPRRRRSRRRSRPRRRRRRGIGRRETPSRLPGRGSPSSAGR